MWFRKLRRDGLVSTEVSDRKDEKRPSPSSDDLVVAALAHVSPKNAAALTLFYCDGLTCRECGEFLGVSAKAVESRLARARQELKSKVVNMTERMLKSHTPDESFDSTVDAEISRLTAVLGKDSKHEQSWDASERLAVLFRKNLDRLTTLISGAAGESDLLAAMRVVRRLGPPAVGQVLSLALSEVRPLRLSALATLPSSDDNKDVYLVLEAVYESGVSEEQKARLLVDLIRRRSLLRGRLPKYVLKRFARDAVHFSRLLMRYPEPAISCLAEVLGQNADQRGSDSYVGRAFAAFGTAGFGPAMDWLDSSDPNVVIAGLKLAEFLGQAIRAQALTPWQGVGRIPEHELLLRVDRVVHPSRIDRATLSRIHGKVATLCGHRHIGVRTAAVAAVGHASDDKAMRALADALERDDSRLAKTAARALGWRYTPARVDMLVTALRDGIGAGAAEEALICMRISTADFAVARLNTGVQPTGDFPGLFATGGELDEMLSALDAQRETIVTALAAQSRMRSVSVWEQSLSEQLARHETYLQKRRTKAGQRELTRRARAYHAAHPEVACRGESVFVLREHWLGVAVGRLPEDRPFTEREINRLISGVGMDPAHIRRWLVDEGWMTRSRSVYVLTDLGRRAFRMEHVMAVAVRPSSTRKGQETFRKRS